MGKPVEVRVLSRALTRPFVEDSMQRYLDGRVTLHLSFWPSNEPSLAPKAFVGQQA